jgi:hypothetical protein
MAETEKYTIDGSEVMEKVRKLIHEGNIRRVRLIHEGRTIIDVPLSIGAPAAVVGIILAPALAAIGAAAALLTECTLEVEKTGDSKK